ncbi:cyclase family protein [Halococcus dombrowskii]|uniref:Cyclase family protein n=1 Tax=Halococcus dombrowskii TaxID=179637 RepID=A0AAV3SEI6_HALDO|nr:cyclase family protein [Halococcus dombrowskii]UOO95099.1 cyclase family protein [Halococcus dombrowskii]
MQIDLSHRIETGMTVYPGDPSVSIEPHATHDRDGCRVRAAQLGSHTGTHIDAPAHVMAEGRTLDTYSVDRFTFDAVRVDCTDLGDRDPITAADVPDEAADIAIFWTGWDSHWGTDRYLEHPYLTADGAAACAERGYAVGVDTLSPDPTPTDDTAEGESSGLQAHRALLGADNLIVENLCNLERTPERFELRAYPMALGGDGAPVRAVGVGE